MTTGATHPEAKPGGDLAKTFGAFYTDTQIADFLVRWAVRSGHERVLDPGFGGGAFLRVACIRLRDLGGRPEDQVYGIELDAAVHTAISDKLSDEFCLRRSNLQSGDFFQFECSPERQVDAVVGNPPFIRYQRFTGDSRQRALERAAQHGVRLSALSSSWAPFLVHSVGMVKSGGRLAMVIPMEIAYAAYARPVLQHLARSFGKVTFLTFRKKLFPALSEDTLLLLAENKGGMNTTFSCRDFAHAGKLVDLQGHPLTRLGGTTRVNTEQIVNGQERLIHYLIPKKARELYRELSGLSKVHALGELADVGIGYVTGANDFFHLAPEKVNKWRIPDEYLLPAVRRGRALAGLRFSDVDWHKATLTGEGGYLLFIESAKDLPSSVLKYLEYGVSKGVTAAFKCRTRSPWFKVPHVHEPDGFLSYMSGKLPLLVSNDARVVAPNSLHILRLHPNKPRLFESIAASWQTSLSRLSVEIEGHALGGGMLKLEPTEAERVLLAVPQMPLRRATSFARELDLILRGNEKERAQTIADDTILKDNLGLSAGDCRLLRRAADQLRLRRQSRSISA